MEGKEGGAKKKEIPWLVHSTIKPADVPGFTWVPDEVDPLKPQRPTAWRRVELVKKELSIDTPQLAPKKSGPEFVIVPPGKPLSLHKPKDIGEPDWQKRD